jgi:hypothetical protein
MPVAQLRPNERDGEREDPVGQLAEVIAEVLNAQASFQILHQESEHLGMVGFADQIHLAFHIGQTIPIQSRHLVKAVAEFLAPPGIVDRLQDLSVEQFIEHDGVK